MYLYCSDTPNRQFLPQTSRMPPTAFCKFCLQFTRWEKECLQSPPAVWKCSYLHKNKQTSFPFRKHRIVCFLPNLRQKWSSCCGFRPAHVLRAPQGWESAHSRSRDSQAAASVKNNTSELWLHLLFCSNEPMLLAAFRSDESCHHSLANLHALITSHHIQHLIADEAKIDLIAFFFQQLDRQNLLNELFS